MQSSVVASVAAAELGQREADWRIYEAALVSAGATSPAESARGTYSNSGVIDRWEGPVCP